MADIVWADVEDIAPALSVVIADAQTKILAYVNATVDPNAFNNDSAYTLAKCYLAAHRGSVTLTAGIGKAVASESMGGLSRSYVVATAGDLTSTSFGQEYLSIVNASPARCPIV
jgi:hypothetical protein